MDSDQIITGPATHVGWPRPYYVAVADEEAAFAPPSARAFQSSSRAQPGAARPVSSRRWPTTWVGR